jgi:hypothetical protein
MFVPPKVGSRRVRTQTLVATHDDSFVIDGKRDEKHQITQSLFKLVEEIDRAERQRVIAIRAEVVDAREVVTIGGRENPQQLLEGTYIVNVEHARHGRLTALSDDGREIGSREEEELADLFTLDTANESGLVRVLRKHPLRVGESVLLGDAEKQALAGGPAISQPIWLTAIAAGSGQATYQLDLTLEKSEGGMKIVRVTQERQTIKPATGQLLAMTLDEHDTESSDKATSDHKSHRVVTFEWTKW